MWRPFAWLLGTANWPSVSSNPPVCIVGAGPSGLIAANELENKGYTTVIFEKQPEVGGKCQAYYEDDNFFPLGAAFYTNATWPNWVKVLDATGVPSVPFGFAGASGPERFQFNFTTGATMALATPSEAFQEELAAEIPRYAEVWEKEFAPISVPSYKNGVPEMFAVSADQWFAANNFTALPILLVDFVALFGYGDIRMVPALYILQYVTPDVLGVFAGLHGVELTDFHKAWEIWTKKFVKGQVNTNTNVIGIDRSGSRPIIRYSKKGQGPYGNWRRSTGYPPSRLHRRWKNPEDGGGYIGQWWPWEVQECSSVILAFPPTLTNLDAVGLELTAAEKEVFSTVGVENYFSSAVEFKGLPFGVAYIENSTNPAVPPPSVGEPVAVVRLHENSTISTSWSWGPYREFEATSQVENLLVTTLAKINKDPRNANAMSIGFDQEDVKAFRKWDYFPHFDSPQLKDGFYTKFDALQGNENTFYASGLNGFETVEWAIRGARDVVDSHFEDCKQ